MPQPNVRLFGFDLKNTNFSRTGVYVGNWKDGLQDGNGTAMYNNGNKYTGQFK